MAKTPDSSKSESWTARVPNHLASAVREHASALGMTRDDGTANTTEIIHAALKQWVGIDDFLIPTNNVIPGVIQQLENQVAELFDKLSNTVSKGELEAALGEVHSPKSESPIPTATVTERVSTKKRVANNPKSEPPIGTADLCKRLGVSFSNLSTRAKRNDRTTEEQLISEALEQGQHWQVCNRNGRSLLWERVASKL